MKRFTKSAMLILLSLALFFSSIQNSFAQYKLNKQLYDYKDYKREMGGPRSPGGAIIASAIIPGLGQRLLGEQTRGRLFVGTEFLSLLTIAYGFGAGFLGAEYYYLIMGAGLAGVITTHVWASIDAGRIAKVTNLAILDGAYRSSSLKLGPDIQVLPGGKPTLGLGLKYSF